ncbi:hypothetical protein [Achromobacter spanius]|uniref:Uncharacterized protein n=1 Tax=Achromobacter spanius TaxID=217203 RepID=A0A2S0I1R4_9BURK|nr:hypothetical protein [Achromobacter spanius]AVJ25962.1 hypothetical protein CLM73_01855 [Achromobacter spanius]
MSNDAVAASYNKLAQDAADGTLPAPQKICTECPMPGPIFSLNPDGGPRNADLYLGITSQGTAATYRWFMDNPWVRNKERNFRDTFLLQVLHAFGAAYGDARLAEFSAFLSVQECEIICLDDEIADDVLSPAVLDEFGRRTGDGLGFQVQRNFVFAGGKLYYLTFTTVTWQPADHTEYIDEDGRISHRMPFTWNIPKGFYPIDRAVRDLADGFERAKAKVHIWEAIKGFFEVATALLAFVPVAGQLALGVRGAAAGVRYLFVAIDRALALDAMVDGTSRMITGEGLSIGEKFFESLAALSDPKTAEERGKQVFMSINLAMLTPSVFGTARWMMRQVGNKAVKLDTRMLSEEELRRLGQHKHGEATVLETVVDTRARVPGGGSMRVVETYSPDTNKSRLNVDAKTGSGDFSIIVNRVRERIALRAVMIDTARKGRGLRNVVGDAGEEVFAAGMVRHWGVKPENILGYNLNDAGPSMFGLKNRSGHGLDMLVWVPPPPEMQIRAPKAEARDHIEGLRGPSEYKTLAFSEETLIVVEIKTTLGKSRTAELSKETQRFGGEYNAKRVTYLAQRGGPYWRRERVLELDPAAMQKAAMIKNAQDLGSIHYMHAQVFLDSDGKINKLVGKGVGQGSGIQLNDWPGM